MKAGHGHSQVKHLRILPKLLKKISREKSSNLKKKIIKTLTKSSITSEISRPALHKPQIILLFF